MTRVPAYIPKDILREWRTACQLNKWFSVDGIQPASFISKSSRDGWEIRCVIHDGKKKYRALDVLARANALGLKVGPPKEGFNNKAVLEQQILGLKAEYERLRDKLEGARKDLVEIDAEPHEVELNEMSAEITGRLLLRHEEIVEKAQPYEHFACVYFLIKGGRVMYVGQSVNGLARIKEHASCRDFDSYAYIKCDKKQLDGYESLYIHYLRPEWNGNNYGGKHAPINLRNLAALAGMARRAAA